MTNLGNLLIAFQQKHDVSGKDLAAAIGIHQSTLTRVKQGLMPDAASMVKVIAWMVDGADDGRRQRA